MTEPTTAGSTDGEAFAIDGHTAANFLAAHLSVLHAHILIKCADEACENDDPSELLHDARIEAAEAQHHINLTAESATKHNAPHLVIGILGPLLSKLEHELDAIRYRAHTPFGDNPAWWRDFNLDLSDAPEDFKIETPNEVPEHKVVRVNRIEVPDSASDVNVRRTSPNCEQTHD